MKYAINEDNFKALVEIIQENKRHCDYDTVCELADLYRMMLTGKDDDKIYRRFYKKFADSVDETEVALYEQLKRISNLILKPVTNRIGQPFNKVPRSNAKTEVLQYTDDTQGTKLKELQDVLNKFWGEKSFNDWMNTRFLELSRLDPNSWVVTEFESTDGTKLTEPYPFEVSSSEAIYFEYIKNTLQYLVVLQETAYTLYGQKSVIKLTNIPKDNIIGLREETRREVVEGESKDVVHRYINGQEIFNLIEFVDSEGNQFIMIGENQFYLFQEFIPHNLGYVNAFRSGYIRDDYTNGRTFVNYFDVALPYLLSTVKVTCEKDLAFALHLFGKRYEYTHKCTAEGCKNGNVIESGKPCTSCHGTGSITMSSTMEVVKIPFPDDVDKIWDLSKMSYTDRPGTEIIQLQLDYIDKLVENCFGVIFNSDTFIKPTIKDTATGELLDYENSYDALYPFAVNFAHVWDFQIKTIAKITSKDSGLIYSMSFGKDFGFETRLELIRRAKLIKDSGLSQDIFAKIEAKIVMIDNADNKNEYTKWNVKQIFNPFYGKSQDEIIVILQSSNVLRKSKVLYENYGAIWDSLEIKHPDIYEKNKTEIRKLLDAEIQEYIDLLDAEKPQTTPLKLNVKEDVELDEKGNPIE
jgi:hypothetical protein